MNKIGKHFSDVKRERNQKNMNDDEIVKQICPNCGAEITVLEIKLGEHLCCKSKKVRHA